MDSNASNSAGQTPLHMAAINGRIEVARFIADKVTITQLNLYRYVRIEWIYVCMCVVRSS